MNWKRILAYITRLVDQELLVRDEYLATENRLPPNQIKDEFCSPMRSASALPDRHTTQP